MKPELKLTQDRVTQTIDRLISNLPDAVIKLKAAGLTSLARHEGV